MQKKSFQQYLEKRLNKDEIAEIEQQAKFETNVLESLKNDITLAISNYMKKNKIGFNELVRRLHMSPAHVAKIQKGEANLTLASLAHLFALLEQEPHLVFNKK